MSMVLPHPLGPATTMRSGTAGRWACRGWSEDQLGIPLGGTTFAAIHSKPMASTNSYRKLFIDSRWRSSGEHNDFTIELTDDVDTTRTTSVYLASCSFANTFETVLQDVNDRLFLVAQDTANAPRITPSNENLYLLYRRDRLLPTTTSANNLVYIMLASTAGVGNPYILYSAPVDPGTYTVEQFASKLFDVPGLGGQYIGDVIRQDPGGHGHRGCF